MTTCLVPQEIARYRAGDMKTEEELLAIEAHLDDCPDCRRSLLAAVSAAAPALRQRLTSPIQSPVCPEPTVLARYAEGRADATDIEWVQTHCEDCPRCAQDLVALIAVRPSVPTADSPGGAPTSTSTWRQRLHRLLFPNGLTAQPRTAAFALSLVAALGALMVYRGLFVPQEARYQALLTQQTNTERQALQGHAYTAGLEKRLQQSDQLRNDQEKRLQNLDARVHDLDARLAQAPKTTPAAYSAQMLAAVEQAMATRRTEPDPGPHRLLAMMDRDQLQVRGGASDPSSPTLIQPAGTLILEDRPTLRWKPVSTDQNCTVTIRRVPDAHEADPNDEQVHAGVTGTTWTVDKPLQRGKRYRWQVIAQRSGAVSSIGQFQVVDAQTAASLHRTAQEYSGQSLTLGILYTKAGLLDTAEAKLASIPRTDPKFAIAHALLQNLRASRSPKDPTTLSK